MTTWIYDIPRTPPRSLPVPITVDKSDQGGDVDYGPDYWIDYEVVFPKSVHAADAARLTGDYLARNYQDDFRQTVAIDADSSGRLDRRWRVRVHLAWGDRPYYEPIKQDTGQQVQSDPSTMHKADPQDESLGVSTCSTCGRQVKRVPGGQGTTWVHEDTGTVVS